MEVEGMLVAYHGAGATFLPNVPKFATQNAWIIPKTAAARL